MTQKPELRLAQRFFEAMCGAMGDGNGDGFCDAEEHNVFIHSPKCGDYTAMTTARFAACNCRPVHLRVTGGEVVAVLNV